MQKNGVYERAWRRSGIRWALCLLESVAAVVQRVSIKSILDGLSVLELRSLNEVIEEINLKAYIYYIVCPE